MSSLNFELSFRNEDLRSLDLPIEIRKPNMVLVKRVRASETVEIEPGSYYIGIKMPAGQEDWTEVSVTAGESKKILLGPGPAAADEAPSQREELKRYFTPQYVVQPQEQLTYLASVVVAVIGIVIGGALVYLFTRHFSLLRSLAIVVGGLLWLFLYTKAARPGYALLKNRWRETSLRLFKGNVLIGECRPDDQWEPRLDEKKSTDNLIELTVSGSEEGQILQLLRSAEPPLNLVLPAGPHDSCRVIFERMPDGRYACDVHLDNIEAELLLRYWEQGFWQSAAEVANSPKVSARLLEEKRSDPVAAAVGAYALLRLGQLEHLNDWSRNLMEWFSWLPDGITIRGEYLARLGEHKQALNTFCDLPKRGLPYFNDGISYVVDRLRLYQNMGTKRFDENELKCCAETLAMLQPFCDFTDFKKPLMIFTGLDPRHPDKEPAGWRITTHGGLAITQQVHNVPAALK